MTRNRRKLYVLILARVYGRYGILNSEVVGSTKAGEGGGLGRGYRTGEVGFYGCAVQVQYMIGTVQPEQWGQEGDGRAKLFPMVGYVLVYGEFYGRGLGYQEGGGTYDPFRVVQYPQRSEGRTKVHSARSVAIQRGPWRLPKAKCYQCDIHEGVRRVTAHGDQGTEHAQWWCHYVLPQGGALNSIGAPPPRKERHQILSGIIRKVMVCHGVLSGPK